MIIKKIMITMTMSCTLVYGYNIDSLQKVMNACAVEQIYTILKEDEDKDFTKELMNANDVVNMAVYSFKADPLNQGENEDTGPISMARKKKSRNSLVKTFLSPTLIFQLSKHVTCRNIFNNHAENHPLCNELRNDVLRALKASGK